jgi:hypothetical protein
MVLCSFTIEARWTTKYSRAPAREPIIKLPRISLTVDAANAVNSINVISIKNDNMVASENKYILSIAP